MAAFDFPSSPSVNQTYTANGVTWKWNGTMWMRVSGAGYLEKIEEGNSKVEVDDSGSGNVTVTTDGTEKLRIDSSGNVGLGTQTPNKNSWNKAVTLEGSSNCAYELSDNGTLAAAFALQGNDRIELMNFRAGPLTFKTQNTERLRIDSSGRLGLGVVPEAYHSNNKAVIRGDSGYAILGRGDNALNISQNFYYDSSDAGKYIANGEASVYQQADGQHVFYSAVSGSANAGASLVERLRITSAGDMGLGTNSPTSFGPTFQVAGTDPALLLQDTATAVDYFGVNVTSGITQLWYDDAAAFTINTATGISGSGLAERFRIASNGNTTFTAESFPYCISTSANKKLVIEEFTSYNSNGGLEIRKKFPNGNVLSANYYLGDIHFKGWDGDQFIRGAKIEAVVEGTPANNVMPCGLRFSTNPGDASTPERLRITKDGKVGINDTSPDANLSVGGSTAFIDVGAAGGNRGKIGYSSNLSLIHISEPTRP